MKLLILALLCASAWGQMWPFPGPGTIAHSGGGGGPAFVSAANANDAASSATITTTSSLTIGTGDLVVVLAAVANRTPTAIACGSNSLTAGPTWLNSGYSVQLWYKQNATSGTTTCTATFNDAGTYRAIAAANYSGAATSGGILHQSTNTAGANNLNATSTSRTASNVTTTTANAIHICAGVDWDGTSGVLTGANGYSVRVDGDTEWFVDKFTTSTGSYPGGNVGTTASTDQYMAFYVVFGAL